MLMIPFLCAIQNNIKALDSFQALNQCILSIMSNCSIHCTPPPPPPPPQMLITLWRLHWENWWRWGRLKNSWNRLNGNLRILLTLLNCSHLSDALLGSLPSCLLGNLLDRLMHGMSSCIMYHLPQGILINHWSCGLRNHVLHMLIYSLSSISGGLNTVALLFDGI
ncbi:hypothetical protein YC2023_023831 [Brassica napus]